MAKLQNFINTNEVLNIKNAAKTIASAYASSIGIRLDEDDNPTFWTLPGKDLYRIKYFKYADFRYRRNFTDRPQNGANAALNGVLNALTFKDTATNRLKKSFKAAKYYASSFIPGGTYTVINLSSPAALGYGWGTHTTKPLIDDFTLQTNVTTRWKHSAKGGWTPKLISKIFPFRGDKVTVTDFGKRNLDDVYLWKPRLFNGPAEKGTLKNFIKQASDLVRLAETQDFIKFYFTGPKLHNGSTSIDDIMVFRAIITTLDDSFSPAWEESRMIGRADPNYYYTGYSRSLQLGFTVYATSRDELKPIWRKLNALAGYTAPIYGNKTIAPTAPWLRMTIGDLFIQQPVLIDSLSYQLHDADTQWEINVEDDPDMKQAPIKISVSMGLKVITDYLPENNGQFYTLSDRNDEYGSLPGTDSWLSDSKTIYNINKNNLRKINPLSKFGSKLDNFLKFDKKK